MYHGLLLINKSSGMTSHDVVARVRRILKMKTVGHAGTLDPLASGLMVILLGEATKLSHYILEREKAYRVTARLGVVSDTLDSTGRILKEMMVDSPLEQVLQAALGTQGALNLPIPLYSAKKVDGKKLYEYAREGVEVEIPHKVMEFYDIQILGQTPTEVSAFLRCSKGSFIRAWVHELGQRLGVGAIMTALERVESAPYSLENACSLEELEKAQQMNQVGRHLIPMSQCLEGVPLVRIQGQDQVQLRNGMISHNLRSLLIGAFKPGAEELPFKIVAREDDSLLALAGIDPLKGFTLKRVFHYAENSS